MKNKKVYKQRNQMFFKEMADKHKRVSSAVEDLKKDFKKVGSAISHEVSREISGLEHKAANWISEEITSVKHDISDVEHKITRKITKEVGTVSEDIQTAEHNAAKWISREAEAVKDAIKAAGHALNPADKIRSFENKAKNFVTQEVEDVEHGIKSIEHKTVKFVADEVDEVKDSIRSIEHKAARWISKEVDAIKSKLTAPPTREEVTHIEEKARKSILEQIRLAEKEVERFREKKTSLVQDEIKTLRREVTHFEHKIINKIANIIADLKEGLKSVEHGVKKAAQRTAKTMSEEVNGIKEGIENLNRDIQKFESKAANWISEEVKSVKHNINSAESKTSELLSEEIKNIKKGIQNTASKAASFISEELKRGGKSVSNGVNALKEGVSNIEHQVKTMEQKSSKGSSEKVAKISEGVKGFESKASSWISEELKQIRHNIEIIEGRAARLLTREFQEGRENIIVELNEIKEAIYDLNQSIKDFEHKSANWISEELKTIKHDIKHAERKSAKWISEEIDSLKESIAEAGHGAISLIKSEIHAAGKMLPKSLEDVKEDIDVLVEGIAKFEKSAAKSVSEGISKVTEGLHDFEIKAANWISEQIKIIKRTVEGIEHEAMQLLERKAKAAPVEVHERAKAPAFRERAEELEHRAAEWTKKEFAPKLKETISSAESAAGNFISKEAEALKHGIQKAERWAAEEVHDLKEGIVKAEHDAAKWISKEAKAIKHVLPHLGEDVHELEDKVARKIADLLESYPEGLTIAGIMKKLDLARHTVLSRLHHFVGKGFVGIRKINMAKLHFWKGPAKKPAEEEAKVVPLEEEHIAPAAREIPIQTPKPEVTEGEIQAEIKEKLAKGKIGKEEEQLLKQRVPVAKAVERAEEKERPLSRERVNTGIEGLDALLDEGIPKGASIIIAGGAGSGKTIASLQIAAHHAMKGKKCLYMSFEESEGRLMQHMQDFGWNPEKLIKNGNLKIQRFNPFDITRNVDALLMKAKGELLIEVEPVILPEGYQPDYIFIDSLTAIASAFTEKEDTYRIYIEQLFRFFEKIGATSFMITETRQIPTVFSQTGVEEFLADGVVVLYNIKRGNIREKAIEVLKLRGAHHEKRIVAFDIQDKGIVVYPEQEIFGEIAEKGVAEQ
jgi:KaiC/GvpD/RAD55 family RecA-like ATPase/phage-related protein